ncbi:MAG TPA: hypothetical protein PKM88_06745 [bacterium]|nr:hypothetical protein [bacterium]
MEKALVAAVVMLVVLVALLAWYFLPQYFADEPAVVPGTVAAGTEPAAAGGDGTRTRRVTEGGVELGPAVNQSPAIPAAVPTAPASTPAAPAAVAAAGPPSTDPWQRVEQLQQQITALQAVNDRLIALEQRLSQLSGSGSGITVTELESLRQQVAAAGSARPAATAATAATGGSASSQQLEALTGKVASLESKAAALESTVTTLERKVVSSSSNWNR